MSTDRLRILRAINYRVRRGQPFVVESIWKGLPDISAAAHKGWVGRQIQELEKAGRIEFVRWVETPNGLKHSRTSRMWQPVAAGGRRGAA